MYCFYLLYHSLHAKADVRSQLFINIHHGIMNHLFLVRLSAAAFVKTDVALTVKPKSAVVAFS
jgi:hypothetical protein